MAVRPQAFLLSHGSFNPVHRHHLEMMVQARCRLEAAGFEVVRGYLAITPGSRLAQKGAEALTDQHRLAALRLGCDSVPGPRGWLIAEPRGVNFGSGSALVNGLQHELQQEAPGALLFKVVGADTALRYRGERKGHVVIICRKGSTEAFRKEIGDTGSTGGLFLVEELSGEECSSTKLRDALRAENEQAIGAMCPEPVAKYLLAHREELYGEERDFAESGPSEKGPALSIPVTLVERPRAATISSPLVIGMTGSTRSGKSTLATRLAQALGHDACAVVGQDDFRLSGKNVPEDSWEEVNGDWLRNWETPSLTNWVAFEGAIEQVAATGRVVLAEGYSLLHSECVRRMLHGVIWVEIDESTCWERRHSYPRGWDRAAYFSQCIWTAHRRYQASVFDGEASIGKTFAGRMLLVSGSEPLDALCSQVLTFVQSWAAVGAVVDQ